mmetsp:Transcript_152204/g.283591  ORF Transcript_152204/g.283591 Transcript_152204/m.283591 type:complete len:458 (+) Transcript_152204:73-1446(+)
MANFCSAIVHAVCLAPVVIILSCWVTGCEEKSAVCTTRSLDAAERSLKSISGKNPEEGEGSLVFFQGKLDKKSISPLKVQLGTYFKLPADFVSPGLKVTSAMMQCIEKQHSQTFNDTYDDPRGVQRTITWYTYQVTWSGTYHDDSAFIGRNKPALSPTERRFVSETANSEAYRQTCQVHNAPWDNGLPKSGTVWTDSAKVESFKIDNFIYLLNLTSEVESAVLTKSGQKKKFTQSSSSFGYKGASSISSIGDARVSFESFDWSKDTFTLLGKNEKGEIEDWIAPDTWLCTEIKVPSEFEGGKVSSDAILKGRRETNQLMKWAVRVLGFIAMWLAFKCCAEPWEVTAECIPCCGECIAAIISSIATVVGFCLALALMFTVIAVMWMVMNPWYSIPMMLIACFIWGWMINYCVKKAKAMKPGDMQKTINSKVDKLKEGIGAREKVALQEPLKFSVVSVV